MGIRTNACIAILGCGIAIFADTAAADAQQAPQRIDLKNGETITLTNYSRTTNSRSTLIGTPVIEVLEGHEEVSLTFKEGKVIPRVNGQNCANPVAGGSVIGDGERCLSTEGIQARF